MSKMCAYLMNNSTMKAERITGEEITERLVKLGYPKKTSNRVWDVLKTHLDTKQEKFNDATISKVYMPENEFFFIIGYDINEEIADAVIYESILGNLPKYTKERKEHLAWVDKMKARQEFSKRNKKSEIEKILSKKEIEKLIDEYNMASEILPKTEYQEKEEYGAKTALEINNKILNKLKGKKLPEKLKRGVWYIKLANTFLESYLYNGYKYKDLNDACLCQSEMWRFVFI